MKKILLFACLAICFYSNSKAQGILVNRYYNSGLTNGVNDVVELVVYTDKLDIRKYIIKDYGNGGSALDETGAKYRFNNIDLWKGLRSGTTIVIRKLSDAELLTYTPDVDGADFKISVAINDVNYFTLLSETPVRTWNLTFHEAVSVRADTDNVAALNGANKAVHTLAYGDLSTKPVWNGILGVKTLNGNFALANATVGLVHLTNPAQASYTTPIDINADLVSLPSHWQKQTNLMTDFPAGIQVFRTTSLYSTRSMNAYAVVFDPKLVEFKPVKSAVLKTPEAFVNDEEGTVYACINAGFFSGATMLSHMQYNGTVLANNVLSLVRNTNVTYYPTRGAFGLSSMSVPDIAWTYRVGSNVNNVYSYPIPAPNNVNEAPQPQPTATGGALWNVVSGVGGSPVLVKGGQINVTADEELANLDNTSFRGRTAIGYTADGKVILLAVEGGNNTVSPNVMGLTLNELANLMKDMGCVAALNLDGGGSTTLRINNQLTVRPSDNGNERTMPGVILIKSKN